MNLTDLQQRHAQALQNEKAADAAFSEADKAYEAKLAALLDADPDLKALHERREATRSALTQVQKELGAVEKEAKAALTDTFLDDLPDGYTQVKKQVIEYTQTPMMFIKAAARYAPWLLKIDEKAVQKLSVYADKNGELPESLMTYLPIKLVTKPQQRISRSTLIDIAVPESDDQTLPIDAAVLDAVTTDDDSAEQPELIPLDQINC